MKQSLYALIPALLIAAVLAMPAATAQSLDGIVAVVGDDVILASELAAAVDQARARAGTKAERIPADALRSKVLDRLIMTRLQLDRAEQLGLTVSDNEMARAIAGIAQQSGMSASAFKQALRSRGIPLSALKQRVREQLLIRKVRRQEVMAQVEVTEQDVTQFLESRSLRSKSNREYHIRHIRIDVAAAAGAAAVEQARQRIEDIRAKAVSGAATFAELARTYSDGNNAGRGGDMGWLGSAFMPATFVDIVPDLESGEISRVFRAAGAFHLVKLIGTRGSQSLAGNQQIMIHQVKARHIVLKPNALRNKERTRELAAEIIERLKAGASFAELAREYSDDKSTANQGGSLGWVRPRELGPREAVRIAQMQAGDVSPVLETRKGYVIVKVTDRRQRDKTRKAIRNRVRQVLGQRKAQEKGRRWLQKLRSQAYIDIRLEGYQRSSG